MKYAVVFSLGAVSLAALAAVEGGVAWSLAWPAMNLVVLAIIYGADRPRWLGKRDDGRLGAGMVFVMLPYFALTWGALQLYRRISSEPFANEVADGLWVGRRPARGELPSEVTLVVDLTAELPRSAYIPAGVEVVQAPSLDARAPHAADFAEAVRRILATPGAAYVHCAAGHGRSAAVAAAALVARGEAADVDAAEAAMRRARPGIGLHGVQRREAARAARAQADQAPSSASI